MTGRMMQRLVDPELCSACSGCYEVCPKAAVVIENRRVAIDPALCKDCGDCEAECATGAIEVKRTVDVAWSVEEQLSWERLPPEEF